MRRWLVPLTLVALAGIASPPAAASSIVYVKGGDIWRYSVAGARKRVIVRAPGAGAFSAVTQDDRGRLWAVREPARRWERYSPAGRRLGKPFNTAGTGLALHYDPVRNLPGFAGPLDAQVSATAAPLAHLGHPRAARPCRSLRDPARAPSISSRSSTRPTSPTAATTRTSRPASDQRPRLALVAARRHVHRRALHQPAQGLWHLVRAGADPRAALWFGPTNSAFRLAHPEVTRRGDHIAATIDTHNALSKDEEITVGHLPGPPPAVPDRDCTWANPHGTVAELTWSPDGGTLAWSDGVGVWTARFAVPVQTGLPAWSRRSACSRAGRHRRIGAPPRRLGRVPAFAAPDVLVLAGGGVIGEAWMTGVLAGIEDEAGADLRGIEAFVGTSAGAIVAARLAAGVAPRRPRRGRRVRWRPTRSTAGATARCAPRRAGAGRPPRRWRPRPRGLGARRRARALGHALGAPDTGRTLGRAARRARARRARASTGACALLRRPALGARASSSGRPARRAPPWPTP